MNNPAPTTRPITPPNSPPIEELVEANEAAARYFREQLLCPTGEGPRHYLQSRGLGGVTRDTPWTVGYAPREWTGLQDHLVRRGFSTQTLEAAGLVCRTRRGGTIDRFRDRLTFGIRDQHGGLVGFTARCAPGASRDLPKYLNTRRTTIYDKSTVLFGLGEQAHRLNDGANLVLVEGPLDALAVDVLNTHDSARLAPMALCGTAITPRHGQVLGSLVKGHIIVAFDADPAGLKAAEATYAVLSQRLTSLFATSLPAGGDPADTLTQLGEDGLQHHLSRLRPLAEAIVDHRVQAWPHLKDNAEARVACLREVARLVVGMTPGDLATQSRRLTATLGLDQATVTRELAEAVSRATHIQSPAPGRDGQPLNRRWSGHLGPTAPGPA